MPLEQSYNTTRRNSKLYLVMTSKNYALTKQKEGTLPLTPVFVISSNFTSEPIFDGLMFWGNLFHQQPQVLFAPYNQVLQQLLNSESELRSITYGLGVILLRWQDWYVNNDQTLERLKRNTNDFFIALEKVKSPLLVIICPASNSISLDKAVIHHFDALNRRLADLASKMPSLDSFFPSEIFNSYPVAEIHDPVLEKEAHIPYSAKAFSAFATVIYRKFHSLFRPPYKAIILDCDNTLWEGVCGEVGPIGVRINAPYQALQQFVQAQHQKGMVLCLNSKNNPEDVYAVFEKNPRMYLDRSHFAAERINWKSKTENIKSLAIELNLSLDSLIFIDDDPVQCWEVRTRCPQVLTLQLPKDNQQIPEFLNNCWAFDDQSTATGAERSHYYRENRNRLQFQKRLQSEGSSSDLSHFIKSLELEIDIQPIANKHLSRAAELSLRSNQFNLMTQRYYENEMSDLLRTNNQLGWIVKASDRFGDYGFVGVMLANFSKDNLDVTDFMLSCRAMGRGVEHVMVRHLGEFACENNLQSITLFFRNTKKNFPALDFLQSSTIFTNTDNESLRSGGVSYWSCSSDQASTLVVHALGKTSQPLIADKSEKKTSHKNSKPANMIQGIYSSIATSLVHVDDIHEQVKLLARKKPGTQQPSSDYIAPSTEAEIASCQIWQEITGLDRVGITDDFFRIGGNSIQAIQVSHRMNTILGSDLRVADIFKYRTLSRLLDHCLGQTQQIIPKINSNTVALSFAQERLWFIEQYEEGTKAYHLPWVLELNGNTDIMGMKYALQQIVSRHEILRSTVAQSSEHEGVQVVHNEPLPIEEVRIQVLDHFQPLISEDINRPFDLEREYPIRVKFYKILSAKGNPTKELDRTILLINTHHIATDAWSDVIFQKELVAYYEAYINNDHEFSLPALEIQYKDYALWQRQHLTGKILDQHLKYWKSKLKGYQNLELPIDYARSNQTDYKGAYQRFTLSKKTGRRLRALARSHSVTLHSVLLSSINVLFGRISGQQDIVIGIPIANRHHRQTGPLIGFFVNTLVIRTILNYSQNFEDLIQQVHQDQMGAQLYQDLPFEKLVEEMQVERESSHHPIFQVMFELQSLSGDSKTMSKQRMYFNPYQGLGASGVERFDLSISIKDQDEELEGHVSYATRLFHSNTITRLIDHYTYLLDQLIQSPHMPYNNFSLLRPPIYKQIVYQWNQTDRNFPRNKTINQLFEEQVKKTPDNIAVVFGKEKLTFDDLNKKSNQLARNIRAHYKKRTHQALKPDTLIALYLNRSLEMVIGILGVLKAGGAYVPIDPSYPQKRLNVILEDTKTEVVLSHRVLTRTNEKYLPKDKLIYIDPAEDIYQIEETSNLSNHSTSTDLAYVIYTSGTTGKPNGAMVEHKSVINLITDLLVKYRIEPFEKFLLFANYVFDASVEQLALALYSGGTLFIPDKRTIHESDHFIDFIVNNRITHLHATPSYLSAIEPSKLTKLKRVVFGAEYLSKDLFSKYNKSIPTVINEYGPTEATVTSLVSINSSLLSNSRIQNVKIYVLDANTQPVPVGVKGELFIGGAGVARGYLNNEELTAKRFIHNPFATQEDKARGDTRLYKTGDLVRWQENGDLEFIGRNDHQVKIRGYRIELSEVEHALAQLPGIKQNCVLVRERKTASGRKKYLVAYYVTEKGSITLSKADIISELSKVLVEYMIPSIFVKIDTLPLTITGKLDKRALPEPVIGSSDEDYVAPTGDTEIILCNIWKEVLRLEKIGIHDEFFRIGGDSILSIQVSNRIKQLGFSCQVKDIFSFKTIANLAKHLSRTITIGTIKSEQGRLSGTFGLLPIQHWFAQSVENGVFKAPHHWNQSFLIKVAELDQNRLSSTIRQLIDHHDMLRVKFVRERSWKQVYQSSIRLPPLKSLDVSNYSTQEIQQRLSDWQSGFDLYQGSLFQIGYLHGYADGSARLFLAFHHMIVDAVSWRIIVDDLKDLYAGKRLTQKGSSYRQWVDCINAYPTQHRHEASYWEAQLESMPSYDRLRDHQVSPSVAYMEISAALTRSLLQRASKAYHTEINDLLLTALAYTLKDLNGMEVQGITLEGHGREAIDSAIDHSRTLGWFTTMFPIKLKLKNTLKKSIQSVKEDLRKIPNKGLGFGVLALDDETSFSLQDLSPISFNYLGQFDNQQLDWQIMGEHSGLSIHPANADHHLIDINGMVTDGKLCFKIMTQMGEEVTYQLRDYLRAHLETIIEHCVDTLEKDGSNYSPSDFKSVRLSQSLIDQLQANARNATK